MCEDLINLPLLVENKRKSVVDYFLRNYFNFIMNGDIKDHVLKEFISDQQVFLQQPIENITKSTNATKPFDKKEIPEYNAFNDFYTEFVNFFDIWSKKEPTKETYQDPIYDELRASFKQIIDEVAPEFKEELTNLLNVNNQSFFIEHKSRCPVPDENSNIKDKQTKPKDCFEQCDKSTFIIPGRSSMDYK